MRHLIALCARRKYIIVLYRVARSTRVFCQMFSGGNFTWLAQIIPEQEGISASLKGKCNNNNFSCTHDRQTEDVRKKFYDHFIPSTYQTTRCKYCEFKNFYLPKRSAWEIKRYYLGVQVQLTFSLYGTAHLLQALICVPKKRRRTLACTQSRVCNEVAYLNTSLKIYRGHWSRKLAPT
jgi:predicted nucleic-acid-binding Zn-ribbon protein